MNINPINTEQNTQNITFKKLPNKYRKIDEYLIRGPHPTFCDLFKLKKEGVTQIYDFRHKSIHGVKWLEKLTCNLLGIKYTRKPYSNLYGEYPTIQEFEQITHTVAQNGKQGGKTLFHCNSGRHRTAHMSAFYELTKGEKSLKTTKEELGDQFGDKVYEIINREVAGKNYHSRKLDLYNGKNPIKKIIAHINNRYANAIKKGQKMFIDTIFGLNNQ